jgi:hypothetical protein
MPRTKINLIDFGSQQKRTSAASARLRRVFQIKASVRAVLVAAANFSVTVAVEL